jgi:hypothetical protein
MPDVVRDQLQSALADRYVIDRELGLGGMATVYLARDVRHDRLVALKVLRHDFGAALGPERFTREIKLAAGLQHPHILTVLDSGETPTGQLWFTMPYVEGESLRDRLCRESQLTLEDALRITGEVADALGYAHQHGVIHRDVKPENILLTGTHALLADFGVARPMEPPRVAQAAGVRAAAVLTETGLAVGTPAYASPEQASGDRALDGRTDVYSLGTVLYEMLAGELPFTGPTPQSLLAKRLTTPAPSVRVVRPEIPVGIDAALGTALARTPADRFATAPAFARALEAGRTSGPTPVRHRLPLVIGAAAAVRRLGLTTLWRSVPSRSVAWLRHPVHSSVLIAASAIVGVTGLATYAWYAERGRGGETKNGLSAPAHTSALGIGGKRVAVATFENRTGDSRLDALGEIIVDWLSQHLARTGLVSAVDPETALRLGRQLSPPGHERTGNVLARALAKETHAAFVVAGSFYRGAGDSLRFEARILDRRMLDSATSEIHEAIVSGSTATLSAGLDGLRAFVNAALAEEYDPRFATLPLERSRSISYDAYAEFVAGMRAYDRDIREALSHFRRAIDLDTAFVRARLWTAMALADLNQRPAADSVARVVARAGDRLVPYDQATLAYIEGVSEADPAAIPRAYRAALEMTRIAPDAPHSRLALGYTAFLLNRPHEALDALHRIDASTGWPGEWDTYWGILTATYHVLGDHRRELEAAQRWRQERPSEMSALAYVVRAAAALGRTADVRSAVHQSLTMSIDTFPAQFGLRRLAALELRAHGGEAVAREIIAGEPGGNLMIRNMRGFAEDIYVEGDWMEARSAYQWSESMPGLPPDSVSYRGFLGAVAARLGDRDGAERLDAWLANRPAGAGYPPGAVPAALWRARIAALLNYRRRALALITALANEGRVNAFSLHADIDFEPLRGYAPFEALLHPRD